MKRLVESLPSSPGTAYHTLARRILTLAIAASCGGLLAGCSGLPISSDSIAPRIACTAPQAGDFVTAATRYPGMVRPPGMFAFPSTRRSGDLIVMKDGVHFSVCGDTPDNEREFILPYGDIELAYHRNSWLFLRVRPEAQGFPRFVGFDIQGAAVFTNNTLARKALIEVRQHLPAPAKGDRPAAWRDARLLILRPGEPELKIAVVDHGQVGKETLKGAAEGTLAGAGVVVGLIPQTGGLILYPPLAGAVIIGGTLFGTASGAVVAENQAQKNAHMVACEDPVLVATLAKLALPDVLAREVHRHMASETAWPGATHRTVAGNCCSSYEDYAPLGILGIVELATPTLELRTDKGDTHDDPEQSRYTLSLQQKARLVGTVTGWEVESVNLSMNLGRSTLDELRKDNAARFGEALLAATQELAERIVMNLQRKLHELETLE